ncbi:Breast cancer 2, early onset [Nesidiocoris tenuis]|uniref:Breast cancer 2, early onset n=1 Tax=Nesidiocoris tenuis TaxID=355587 RepID=A0ABN7BAI9_9HEMI|nr:Breast cancer 2, early onset [Nesidiocoris tenuis]
MPKTPETEATNKRGTPSTRGGKKKVGSKAKKQNVLMPKLPLYSSSSKSKANVLCTKDDILKQVKAIDDADKLTFKKPGFSGTEVPTRKFLPSSLLGSGPPAGSSSAFIKTIKSGKSTVTNDDHLHIASEKRLNAPGELHIKSFKGNFDCSQSVATAASSLLDMSDFSPIAHPCQSRTSRNLDQLNEVRCSQPLVRSVDDQVEVDDDRRSPTFNVFPSAFNYQTSQVHRQSDHRDVTLQSLPLVMPEDKSGSPVREKVSAIYNSELDAPGLSKNPKSDGTDEYPIAPKVINSSRMLSSNTKLNAVPSSLCINKINPGEKMIDTVEVTDDVPCSVSIETLNRLVQRPNSFSVRTSEKNNAEDTQHSSQSSASSVGRDEVAPENLESVLDEEELYDLKDIKQDIPSDNEVVDDCILPSCRSPILLDQSYTSSEDMPKDFKPSQQSVEAHRRAETAKSSTTRNLEDLENLPPSSPTYLPDVEIFGTPQDGRSSKKKLDTAQKLFSESQNSLAIGDSPKQVSGRKSHSASPNMKLVSTRESPKRPVLGVKNSTQSAETRRQIDDIPASQRRPLGTESTGRKRHDLEADPSSSPPRDEMSAVTGLKATKSQQLQGKIIEAKGFESEPAGEIMDLDIGSEFAVDTGVRSVTASPDRRNNDAGCAKSLAGAIGDCLGPTFKTASGKSVKVTQKSLDRMKALASEFFSEAVEELSRPTIHDSTFLKPEVPQKIDSSLSRQHRSSNTTKNAECPLSATAVVSKPEEIGKNLIGSAFKTAAGTSVNVSQKSVDKMKALAQEIFGDDAPTIDASVLPRQTDHNQPSCSSSYPTPGIEKDDSASVLGKINIPVHNNVGVIPAFKSAGGKSVTVSKKSLDKMMALASECFGEAVSDAPSTKRAETAAHHVPRTSTSQISGDEQKNGHADRKHRSNVANSRRSNQRSSNPLGSPEWDEFPELPYSQAAILDEFLDGQKPEENITASTNQENLTRHRNGQSSKNLKNVFEEPSFENLRKRKQLRTSVEGVKKKFRPEISSAALQEASELKKRLQLQQQEIIDAKENLSTVPVPGLLSRKKIMPGRLTLLDFNEEMKTVSQRNVSKMIVKSSIAQVSSENAVRYRFHSKDQVLETGARITDGSLIADSCMIVFAEDGTAGLPEVSMAFLSSPHVSPDLVPKNWLANHYRWIVWKLACVERAFPEYLHNRCLTLENILLQLKHRYDKDIELSQRSAFRKILEGDAPPNRLICCIASVKKNAEEKYELELTDGWYSIWATCDNEMVNLLERDTITIGTKILVHGAEITNCQQGCNPLEVPSDVRLKISTNSTRRVKWYAKLGFTQQNTPIPTILCTVLPNGGRIGRLTATVVRKYPPIYLCKDVDGKTVSRSERSLAILNEQRQKSKSNEAERVYAQLWEEIAEQYKPARSKRKVSAAEIATITNPEELFAIVDGMDDESVESQLSAEQLKLVAKFKENLTSKIKHEVIEALKRHMNASESELKVTKLLKVRLLDFITEEQALLTIWRPSEEDVNELYEHKAYDFYDLDAVGTRDKLLQLSNLKRFCHVPNDLIPEPDEKFRRKATPISALNSSDFCPTFDEVDLVGIVVFVKKPQGQDSGGVTVVYLADPNKNCVSITFWTSLSVFGCENVIKEGSVISCSNLQWRPVSNQRYKIPVVFAKEFSSFSLNPKQSHLQEAVHVTKTKLAEKNIESLLSSVKAFIGQTTRINVNSPSPASNKCRPTLSPAQERLKLLSRYGGEGPPLSPVPMVVSTGRVFQEFKSPCRTPGPKDRQQARRILDDLPPPAAGEKRDSHT